MRAFTGRAREVWRALRSRPPGAESQPRVTKQHPVKPKRDRQRELDVWQIVHPNVEHVHGPEEVVYGMDELIVLCLVRDGRPYVRSFVEHYASMGVKHIVFLDNGSTDGTVEALRGYDNVTVLRSRLPVQR